MDKTQKIIMKWCLILIIIFLILSIITNILLYSSMYAVLGHIYQIYGIIKGLALGASCIFYAISALYIFKSIKKTNISNVLGVFLAIMFFFAAIDFFIFVQGVGSIFMSSGYMRFTVTNNFMTVGLAIIVQLIFLITLFLYFAVDKQEKLSLFTGSLVAVIFLTVVPFLRVITYVSYNSIIILGLKNIFTLIFLILFYKKYLMDEDKNSTDKVYKDDFYGSINNDSNENIFDKK